MTDAAIFEKLFNGGNYALPYLIKFSHSTAGTIRLVNNNEDITYNGEEFSASAFDYCPPDSTGAGGSLNISAAADNNKLFNFIDKADSSYRLDIIGVMAESGEVQPLRVFTHFFGSVTIDENGAAEFSLQSDDRLDMTFPPYDYDTELNAGNA